MNIAFFGANADSNASDLLRWLQDEKISGVTFDQKHAPVEPGSMGLEILPEIIASAPYISAVVSAPADLLIIKSIGGWIKATKRRAKIHIKCPNGAELEIETEGNKNVDDKLLELSRICGSG
jgi:hypothetical protein